MKKIILVFLLLFTLEPFTSLCAKESVHIGVLAHKNYESTHMMWDPTAEYLNTKIPEYDFHITPLRFEEFLPYLRDRKIDFVITNSAYYVDLESSFGISRIATLKNKDFNGKVQTEFGGVIFKRASNTAIQSVDDLKNKKFAAVDAESFGGWIMALRELKEQGISEKDLKTTFYGTHESAVFAVLDGKADAGTVRTDTLERMAGEGKINLNDFTLLEQKNYPDFFYQTSTRLYPEWPIATTKHTSNALAEKVAVALISMPQHSEAAEASKSMGWTIPLDYQSIHECLRELEMGPYKHFREDAFISFVKQYWYYGVITLLVLLVSQFIALYIARINAKLRDTQQALETLNDSLEDKIRDKTEHLYSESLKLEEAYLNEKYLRSILRTVADVNQMLITTRSKDELIDKATLCLSSNESFKRAKISLVHEGELSVAAAYGIGEDNTITWIERKVYEEKKNFMITNMADVRITPECRENIVLHGIKAIYALPLKSSTFSDEVIGVLTICTGRDNGFSVEEQKMIEELSGDIGFALNSFTQQNHINELYDERLESYESFIDAMVNMIEQRDTYTAGHTVRVAYYAELIAKEMELSEKEIQLLVESAKLHDIGKVVTPDSILLKPGKLSNLEYELIKEHAKAGYEVLSNVHLYKELADIMVDHHERYDGSGYPYGKKGGEISLLGHIMAVADSFDAMTTNRIYKPRKEVKESLIELSELSGTWYHPAVVNAAVKVLSDIEIDTTINQIGQTPLEEERLSYFFKDRLTKLYNEDYFMMVINGRSRYSKPNKFTVISLIDFHRYNKAFGWESGNTMIARFADFLMHKLPERLMFRVWGDRFVIADFEGNLEEVLSESPLVEAGIKTAIKEISTTTDNLEGMLRDKVI
ncbi:MAG: PhnD/SsuA/transferrin family substrate-binding protein [Sulfuricurvum sp.]|uniref:PhnD/SsuA/transferrin family substrate-binding protein n=1 Tax=Sulfuricurvum sp. TaxID=2025608 RepID=UPI00260E744A|nr:PhnD/SsuA/transferrin family substrate-binding protein [Sulfuricurvum sp.]MDD2830073.1 PhnD/SsuA/transferrin family substrate-binding protein [Sulfuricurvum sp.]MDD4948188.1 PhnD/SsuA/transferrin family substrate-binding protein [Sulfuricurvum sp.]